jgi:hypothetical protein
MNFKGNEITCQKYRVQLIEKKVLKSINLNVNKVLIIHYENKTKIYPRYSKIYLEYIQNMSLFHSKPKTTLLLYVLPKIYK